MDKSELTAIFEKYCRKLRIVPDWDVKLEFVEDPTWRKTGDFKIDCEDKKAVFLAGGIRKIKEIKSIRKMILCRMQGFIEIIRISIKRNY